MASTESMIIFFTMYGLYGSVLWTRDNDINLLSMGTMCFTAAVTFINTKMLSVFPRPASSFEIKMMLTIEQDP